MKKLILLLLWPALAAAQGNLGSNSSPTVNNRGIPLANVNIAACQPLSTTAASVSSGVAYLTMVSNPQTAGFVVGMKILVSGFTGSDTYLNAGSLSGGTIVNGVTILSTDSATITFALNHANATATSNGTALQMGNAGTSCAALATVYSDSALTQAVSQPFQSDQLGNWNVFAPNGAYYVQFYGSSVSTTIKQIMAGAGGVFGGNVAVGGNLSVTGTSAFSGTGTHSGTETFTNINNIIYVDGTKYTTIATAIAALPASGGDVYVPSTVTAWAGGTIPANVRVHFQVAAISLTGPITLGANDEIDCAYGRSLDAIPYRAGTVFTTSGFTGTQDGFYAPQANGVSIHGCTVLLTAGGRHGIYLAGVSDARIENNTIVDPATDGILVDNTGQQSYDNLIVGNIVSHPGRDAFGFRTDGGTLDIDRMTLIGNSCRGRDPGGSVSSGANCYHLYVPSGAATTQTINDTVLINDFGHLSAPGGTSSSVYLDYEGADTTHAFIGGTYVFGAEHEADEGGANCTALKITSAAPVNIQAVTFDAQVACSTDTNIGAANAVNWSFREQNANTAPRMDTLNFINNLLLTETTAPSGSAGKAICYDDSTSHAPKCSFNNDAFSQPSRFVDMGRVFNAAGTQQTSPHIVKDTCTLGTNCGITLSGSAVFTSNTSYDCWARDATTAANAVTVTRTSGSALAFTGTGTDVINYECIGN